MATLDNLGALGYTVGLAHGSVQVEQDALDAARAAADPALIQEQANTVVADTVTALTKLGRVPDDESERLQMFAQMGETAFQTLTTASTERVAFHERALAIAQESPDVWHIAGPGFEGYVSCKDDGTGWDDDNQAMLDALANPEAHAERSYQVDNPEAMQAAQQLASLGRVCTRPTPGADAFEIDGATYSGADVIGLAEKAADEPPPLTPAEKVVSVLERAPELSDATKQRLRDALR